MKLNFNKDSLHQEYEKIFNRYSDFTKEVVRQIDDLLYRNDIKVAVPIQSRLKNWESIENKLTQGVFNIKKSITELQDLVGVRIILLFKRDIDKVINLIENNMVIKKQYDTLDKLSENEFGYSSVHVIAKLKEEWLTVPTLSQYHDMMFEMQLRTLSQHNWAEVSNLFQYKQKGAVPKPLLRSISRISALLEIVDIEFERLIINRENYKEEIYSEVETQEITLNVDTLAKYLDENLPPDNKDRNEEYADLLDDLEVLQLNSLEKLEKLFKNYRSIALTEEQRIIEERGGDIEDPERYQKGVFFTHTGLVRSMLSASLKEPWYLVKEKILKTR